MEGARAGGAGEALRAAAFLGVQGEGSRQWVLCWSRRAQWLYAGTQRDALPPACHAQEYERLSKMAAEKSVAAAKREVFEWKVNVLSSFLRKSKEDQKTEL